MPKLFEPICVAPTGDQCGEGLLWHPEESALYWVDIGRFLVHRMDWPARTVKSWDFGAPPVALFLTSRPDKLLVALGDRLVLWNPETNHRTDHGFRLASHPEARLNDGRAGPMGEIFIGSMSNNVGAGGEPLDVVDGLGELFILPPGGPPRSVKKPVGIANTICFSPDRRYFYFADSMKNIIWRYDYDGATSSLSGERPHFAGFPRGAPDGSAIDAEGCLWNCRFGGASIVRIRPDGNIDRIIEMPVSNITTAEFGGADRKTLFITTAAMLTQGYERLAGSLFALETEVPGLPPYRVRI